MNLPMGSLLIWLLLLISNLSNLSRINCFLFGLADGSIDFRLCRCEYGLSASKANSSLLLNCFVVYVAIVARVVAIAAAAPLAVLL